MLGNLTDVVCLPSLIVLPGWTALGMITRVCRAFMGLVVQLALNYRVFFALFGPAYPTPLWDIQNTKNVEHDWAPAIFIIVFCSNLTVPFTTHPAIIHLLTKRK